jgi:hypothetical protein
VSFIGNHQLISGDDRFIDASQAMGSGFKERADQHAGKIVVSAADAFEVLEYRVWRIFPLSDGWPLFDDLLERGAEISVADRLCDVTVETGAGAPLSVFRHGVSE